MWHAAVQMIFFPYSLAARLEFIELPLSKGHWCPCVLP